MPRSSPVRRRRVETEAGKRRREVDDPGGRQAIAIGNELRDRRVEMDLTLEDVEANGRLSAPYLSKIENGKFVPPPGTVQIIVDELGLPEADSKRLMTEADFARDCSVLVGLGYPATLAWLATLLRYADEDLTKKAAKAVEKYLPKALEKHAGRRASNDLMSLVDI